MWSEVVGSKSTDVRRESTMARVYAGQVDRRVPDGEPKRRVGGEEGLRAEGPGGEEEERVPRRRGVMKSDVD